MALTFNHFNFFSNNDMIKLMDMANEELQLAEEDVLYHTNALLVDLSVGIGTSFEEAEIEQGLERVAYHRVVRAITYLALRAKRK